MVVVNELQVQVPGSRACHLDFAIEQNKLDENKQKQKMRLRNYKVYCKRTNPILSAPKVTKNKKKRENSISQSK
jgi:hypothetical protein